MTPDERFEDLGAELKRLATERDQRSTEATISLGVENDRLGRISVLRNQLYDQVQLDIAETLKHLPAGSHDKTIEYAVEPAAPAPATPTRRFRRQQPPTSQPARMAVVRVWHVENHFTEEHHEEHRAHGAYTSTYYEHTSIGEDGKIYYENAPAELSQIIDFKKVEDPQTHPEGAPYAELTRWRNNLLSLLERKAVPLPGDNSKNS